jgi:hypothetical protein
MATNFSAQGSITIKRLRAGDTIFITMTSDKALFQGVGITSGTITPDWTIAANQPTITPTITTARNANVTILTNSMVWKYLGTTLSWGDESGGWKTDTTNKFMLNTLTGQLKIIANLASVDNVSSDVFSFSATVRIGGVEYPLEKTVEVLIQKLSASSYVGFIDTTNGVILSSTLSTTSLKMKLIYGNIYANDFYVDIFKDTDRTVPFVSNIQAVNGVATKEILRSDINGSQLFVVGYKINSTDTAYAALQAIIVYDNADDYAIHLYTDGNASVDNGMDVTVRAKIINMTSGSEVVGISPTWSLNIMATSGSSVWQSIKSSATNSIVVTTNETDRDGGQNDVTVIGEASW